MSKVNFDKKRADALKAIHAANAKAAATAKKVAAKAATDAQLDALADAVAVDAANDLITSVEAEQAAA